MKKIQVDFELELQIIAIGMILYPPITTITWLLPFRVKVTRKRSLTPDT